MIGVVKNKLIKRSYPLFLIAPDRYPGLCNSLFAFATIYAFCRESGNKTKFIYLGNKKINFNKDGEKVYKYRDAKNDLLSIFFKVAQKTLDLFPAISTTLAFSPESSDNLSSVIDCTSTPIVFIRGWGFHDIGLLTRFRSEILVNLRIPYLCQIIPSPIYSESQISLGVHVRRTDYREFLNGKYFYNSSVYRAWISHCLKQIDCDDVQILFFTDDRNFVSTHFSDIGHLASRPSIESPNSATEDLINLSKCDFILGPPSTFSMWASYLSGTCLSMHMYESVPKSSDIFIDFQHLLAFNAAD